MISRFYYYNRPLLSQNRPILSQNLSVDTALFWWVYSDPLIYFTSFDKSTIGMTTTINLFNKTQRYNQSILLLLSTNSKPESADYMSKSECGYGPLLVGIIGIF